MKSISLYTKYKPLLFATLGLIAMPFALEAMHLSLNTGITVVTLVIVVLGLNLCVGYTGLVSFGHGVWFGIGAYAAGLMQLNWFRDQIWLPTLLAVIFVALLSTVVGALILRRRGVYFSLLTLALSALAFTVAYRWSEVTGGEDGLGGLKRGRDSLVNLDDPVSFYILVSLIALAVLYLVIRIVRSPFGHVLMAIRENQVRATFQGYPIQHYKLVVFVISAAISALGGALVGFHNYIVSAEAVSVTFSGELLAMVIIGGMHSMLGPALGVLFFITFRELFSIWTSNWLLWFGIVFVLFTIYAPGGLVGIWNSIARKWRPLPEESAAMSRRKIYEGLPLPAFLTPKAFPGIVLDAQNVSKSFGGIQAVSDAGLQVNAAEIHGLIGPNGAGKTTMFNLISGFYTPDKGTVKLHGSDIQGTTPDAICHGGLARSFQITNLFQGLSIYENLRLSLQAKDAMRMNIWRDIDSYPHVHEQTTELVKFLGLEGIEDIRGGDLSYGGQRLVDLGIALGSKPLVLLLDEPLAGLAAAERERVSNLVKNIAKSISVLIVEHDIDRLLGFSHRITVMNQGRVLMHGSPEEVRNDHRVQEIYTGSGIPPLASNEAEKRLGPPVLKLDSVNASYGKSHILNDATLNVREGEIVALLGRNGAGKSTLLKTLAGLVTPTSGTIEFENRNIAGLDAPDIARLGIGYVPQGRGLFAGMSVRENLALGRLARKTDGSTGAVWDEEQIFHYFPRIKERMNVAADYLSGGEQQMVAVARAMSGNVKLLLLDEPFEGLAPAVVLELFKVFDQLREQTSIVIVEHNLDLVLALADRVFALERGAVFHEGPASPLLTDLEYRKKILWL